MEGGAPETPFLLLQESLVKSEGFAGEIPTKLWEFLYVARLPGVPAVLAGRQPPADKAWMPETAGAGSIKMQLAAVEVSQ